MLAQFAIIIRGMPINGRRIFKIGLLAKIVSIPLITPLTKSIPLLNTPLIPSHASDNEDLTPFHASASVVLIPSHAEPIVVFTLLHKSEKNFLIGSQFL